MTNKTPEKLLIPKDYGKVGTKQGHVGAGKAIDEWSYTSPIDGKKVTANIFMSRKEGVHFHATLAQGVTFKDTDIARLQENVQSWWQEQDLLRTQAQWENWLEVIVAGSEASDKNTQNLSISWREIPRGITPDGKIITLNNGWALDFPEPKKAGESDKDTKRPGLNGEGLSGWRGFGRPQHSEYTYLPDTPENREGLLALQQNLNDLHLNIAHLVGQGRFIDAAANIQARKSQTPR